MSSLPGKPDVVFSEKRIVVFCDGDFWHGRKWTKLKRSLSNSKNGKYWISKIDYNRKRDRIVARELRARGWTVIRFWEQEIIDRPDRIAREIADALDRSESAQ